MSEATKKRSIEDIKHEYSDASQNWRHYSHLRFAIFSVYFAITAGMMVVVFSDEPRFPPLITQFTKIGGLLITLSFWSYQERASQMAIHFGQVLTNLERSLGHTQYSTRPPNKFPVFKAVYVTRILFVLFTAFWIYSVYAAFANR